MTRVNLRSVATAWEAAWRGIASARLGFADKCPQFLRVYACAAADDVQKFCPFTRTRWEGLA